MKINPKNIFVEVASLLGVLVPVGLLAELSFFKPHVVLMAGAAGAYLYPKLKSFIISKIG